MNVAGECSICESDLKLNCPRCAEKVCEALRRIEAWTDADPSKVFTIETARSLARAALSSSASGESK